MPKSRYKRTGRPPGRPKTMGPSIKRLPSPSPRDTGNVPPSLPLVASETALASQPAKVLPKGVKCKPDSKIRRTALRIVAMRASGMKDPEIAQALGISEHTISPYLYRAGKNGWFGDGLSDPSDRVEYQLLHKVVQNLDEMLDSSDILSKGERSVKQDVTLEMAKGTLFKKWGEQTTAPAQQTVVAIKIEVPSGSAQTMREDTVGGIPNHIEAEVA